MSEVINRDSKYATTSSEQGGLLDVLLALKSNIMRGLNVATFAEVQEVDEANQIVTVRPFPLVEGESEKNIACFSCLMPHLDGENVAFIPDFAGGVGFETKLSVIRIHSFPVVQYGDQFLSALFNGNDDFRGPRVQRILHKLLDD